MVGSNLKDQQLQQIVDKTIMEADLDRDGKISFEEFAKMVESTDVSMSMTLGQYSLFLCGGLRSGWSAQHGTSIMRNTIDFGEPRPDISSMPWHPAAVYANSLQINSRLASIYTTMTNLLALNDTTTVFGLLYKHTGPGRGERSKPRQFFLLWRF